MPGTVPIYQLKIQLRHIKPPIWRRVLVPADTTLSELHDVLQAAMGWLDYHLHLFTAGGVTYKLPDPEDDFYELAGEDERRVTLTRVAPREKAHFEYEYDFGDGWTHLITVEKILPPEPGRRYPVCLTGKRATPPEDSGGPYFYDEFLEALRDPEHEEHETYVQWAGPFDPERFDLEAANARLASLKRRRRRDISEQAGTEADAADALVSLRVPRALRERAGEIIALTDRFAVEHLDPEYVPIARRVVAALARKRPSPLAEGTPELWAGAVLGIVTSFNGLLDSPDLPRPYGERIAAFAGLPLSRLRPQSQRIIHLLNLGPLDQVLPRHREVATEFMLWLQDVEDGFADAVILPPSLVRFEPLLPFLFTGLPEADEPPPLRVVEPPRPQLRLIELPDKDEE